MQRILARSFLGLALLVGMSTAGPAQAGTTDITFDLTGTLNIQGLAALGPPGSGSVTITFPTASASFTHALPGPVHVTSLVFNQAINVLGLVVGQMQITGASLGGTAAGGNLAINGPTVHVATGFVQCFLGTQCVGFGLPSGGTPFALTSAPLGPVALAGASAVVSAPKGAATFNLNGSIGTFLGFLVTGNFTRTEVSRTHVPEPGSLPLFAAALAAVVVLWGARRLRA